MVKLVTTSGGGSMENYIWDDIVRRRLQNDGDGMGDDRKLNSLAKAYIILAEGEENEESDADQLRRFIQSIKHMEYIAKRTVEAIKINEEAKQNYIDLKAQVQSEVKGTKEHIDKSKALLEEATKHRKYSMEYDALAKLIESKPDRKLTEIKRMGLALELEVLKKRQARIQDQLDHRKRTVSMLSGAIEVVKDLVKFSDEKASRHRKSKKSKKRKHHDPAVPGPPVTPMDVDSTSQSEPPSPAEQLTPQEDVNGVVEPVIVANSITTIPPLSASVAPEGDKSNSEKYEDLSESEVEENS